MKRALKWTAIVVLAVGACGLLAFLYFIPPFFTTPPETFTATMRDAAPPVADIADPAERAIAERGRDIVVRTGCIGCHAMNGPQGPDYSKYMAGGGIKMLTRHATYVSRNLTSDPETGLPGRTNDQVKRILRSGVFPDGHVTSYSVMPWGVFSHWTEEDRHAVLVYLRHLPPVRHAIAPAMLEPNDLEPGELERNYAFKEYGVPEQPER